MRILVCGAGMAGLAAGITLGNTGHDVINAMPGVESESEGVEPSRRIVVRPVA